MIDFHAHLGDLWRNGSICGCRQSHPILDWIRTVPLAPEAPEAIADGNAREMLGLGTPSYASFSRRAWARRSISPGG